MSRPSQRQMKLQSSMDQEFTFWQAEGLPRVEYSLGVMEELRVYADEGFQKIPHGGIEVGAILLGERDGETIRIQEWRPMACDHARGPGFVLSPADRDALAELLADSAKSPELNGLSVVGWFHTHTRSKIFLSLEDRNIHETYFTEAWQVALVMRPQKDQLPAAGFFCRDSDGTMNCEASAAEFIVRPDPAQAIKPKRASAAVPAGIPLAGAPSRMMSGRPEAVVRGPETMTRQDRPLFRDRVMAEAPTVEPRPPRPSRLASMPAPFVVEPGMVIPEASVAPPPAAHAALLRFPPSWVAAALVAIAALTAGVQLWRANLNVQGATLKVEEADQSLQISWDKSSSAVVSADRAVLRIVDGSTVRSVPLSKSAVRNGSDTYMRQADDVEVRLTLFEGNQAGTQMFARYVGAPAGLSASPPALNTTASASIPSPQRLRLQGDVARLREALRNEADRADRLHEELALLEKTSGGPRRR